MTLIFSQKRKRDSFGRLLADIEVDGQDVAEAMLAMLKLSFLRRYRAILDP